MRVPDEPLSHPIWRLVDNPVLNELALRRMPAFLGTNLIRRLKSAATLLGETLVNHSRVWDRTLFWRLLLGLLAVEWAMRRRAGFG